MADFTLHLQAQVCCKYICHVMSLPHKWWVDVAAEFKTEEVWRQHAYGHKDVESVQAPKAKATTRKRVQEEDPELGGLASWRRG